MVAYTFHRLNLPSQSISETGSIIFHVTFITRKEAVKDVGWKYDWSSMIAYTFHRLNLPSQSISETGSYIIHPTFITGKEAEKVMGWKWDGSSMVAYTFHRLNLPSQPNSETGTNIIHHTFITGKEAVNELRNPRYNMSHHSSSILLSSPGRKAWKLWDESAMEVQW